ncbi:hypothetical protein E0Z10_g2563 [Xylaria hypoxylon]|uniref:Aminoglycoside phosphotransferase domain-containing protein n=1 Tax=Xylaria hypoxylon TaxID=37992 RepID=A0A4Z0Z5U6_9PEZI|nr:hypothetical protein E0Z10_g2563 [Xylaria hypoxylon]
MAHNHTNYQARLDFIQRLLYEHFNLETDAKIEPISYDPECPFKYNNFVYRVTLPIATTSSHTAQDEALQPGCVRIPDGITQFIMCLTNPDAEGMSPKTRVENEVALISLAAQVLNHFQPPVVPSVYAWGSAATKSSQGWIIQQLMPGEPVESSYENMNVQQKKGILSQMARLLKGLQDFQLPETITGFGGVTFDKKGRIVITTNLLFDPSTQRITGLIDYDFGCILHPSYEFLRSLGDAGGQFRGWSSDEASEEEQLRKAKLYGFPSPLPATTKDGKVDWEVAKAWETEIEKLNVKRPATIRGIDKVADVDTILRTILPWRVSNSDILRMQSEKVIMKCRDENETQLVQLLERLGF